ncbi:MAG: alpha/beta fold hydrolase [Thermomicrobiales bacterium]|nr:alpha/beta fold hydrolase [Thermomicrobiales bacterium]
MVTNSLHSSRTAGSAGILQRIDTGGLLKILGAIAVPAVTGLAMAFAMPRGPVTANDALLLMVSAFLAGIVAGYLMRSRWAFIVGPAAHIVAFELGRIDAAGPTVDSIHLGSTFGILAFLSSRGVFIVLALLPLVIGAAYGLVAARFRFGGGSETISGRRHWAGRLALGVPTLLLVALAAWIAMPASTPALSSPTGEPVDGGIAELTSVNIGGVDQWLEIRGANEDLPVLLYLSGGPGQSDLALSRALLTDLTTDFIVVGWDQRGTGKSYAAFDPDMITPEVAIADTIDVTNYLRERFDEEKIYLMGESWGSLLGVMVVDERPDLFYAYIGSGQMVDPKATDQRIYADLLAEARRRGDDGLVEQLEGFGPPPYDDLWAYGVIMQHYPLIEGDYDPPQAYLDRGEESGVGFWGIMGSEYTPIDKVNVLRGLIDVFAVMYPQLQEIDFRVDIPTLDVPVYLFDGEHELAGRRDLAHEWFDLLQAPDKAMFTFPDAGHAVAFEHADDLHRVLVEEILPATYPDQTS